MIVASTWSVNPHQVETKGVGRHCLGLWNWSALLLAKPCLRWDLGREYDRKHHKQICSTNTSRMALGEGSELKELMCILEKDAKLYYKL